MGCVWTRTPSALVPSACSAGVALPMITWVLLISIFRETQLIAGAHKCCAAACAFQLGLCLRWLLQQVWILCPLHPSPCTRTAECLRGLSVVPNSTHVCGSVTPADGRQVKLTGCWWWQAAAAVAAGRAAAAVPGHAQCRAAGAACGLQSGAACGKGRGVVQWRSTVLRAASVVHATCHTSKQWD